MTARRRLAISLARNLSFAAALFLVGCSQAPGWPSPAVHSGIGTALHSTAPAFDTAAPDAR